MVYVYNTPLEIVMANIKIFVDKTKKTGWFRWIRVQNTCNSPPNSPFIAYPGAKARRLAPRLNVPRTLIVLVAHGHVVVEEFDALFPVQFFHEAGESVAAAEDLVELVVAEADAVVVGYGAAVVNLVYVGPQAGAEAHCAWFAGGVEFASAQIE